MTQGKKMLFLRSKNVFFSSGKIRIRAAADLRREMVSRIQADKTIRELLLCLSLLQHSMCYGARPVISITLCTM